MARVTAYALEHNHVQAWLDLLEQIQGLRIDLEIVNNNKERLGEMPTVVKNTLRALKLELD